MDASILICPLCSAPLQQVGKSLQCAQSHTFDIAREGYANLLPARGKQPKFLGDSREMLQARRRFLEAGYYAALSDPINQIAAHQLSKFPGSAPMTILDAGCGEGYFLSRLKQHLATASLPTRCYGIDLSKDAAKMAAKRHKDIGFWVADLKRSWVFVASSIDLLLNIFAPRNPAEFRRVLKPDGGLLVVIPQPDHLIELREEFKLLKVEGAKADKVVDVFSGAFRLIDSHMIRFGMHLTRADTACLIHMTPNHRHLSDDTLHWLETRDRWEITAAFTVLTFQKAGA